ncbi:hypothetical protein BC938DRAFT_474771 [Jimgerdemannia flammicorona]|uniref:Uncharacterized protein n=1 Tax=Jimgerdemannia flammicorona TaxID=994334 RepID=A0A433Q1J4_9FUNG|nr:hypothetical protein BC938DRAFT_474771 [Jimgerdemannia flammicorona]
MISFSTGGSDQTANVKSVEVASQGYLSFTEATHDSIRHADETSQTVPLFNISPDSSTSSQSSYHGSFLGMDDWNAQQDIQNDLPRFLPDLIGFPTLHSFDPSLLQATQTTTHTFFHHARLPPFPQLPQAPIPPSLSHLFAPQLHQHQSPITPPPHNTRTLASPPAQDSPCSGYINIPPLHKPCLASSPVQPPYEVRPVSPAQPHHHPSQQSGAFPQTFTSFASAPTEPPSLRLARLLRINYPYQPSPQYLQQQTVTGEMVATVTVGTLGTFVSKRRSGRIGMGEKEGEVSVGDLMEDPY